jgi:microcystin degradation protein MlrC
MVERPRIAICGIHIECSTFSPHRSTVADFQMLEGDDLIARYDFLAPGRPLADTADHVGIFHARALPGGVVTPDTYRFFADRILDGLRRCGRIDGLLLDIHGAMAVSDLDDAEGSLITAIRAVIGPDVLVSAAMDLHGNVSETLFNACDLLTCYRTAPHVDVWETRERALRNLVECLADGIRPQKALVHVPVLLPGEMTSTRMEPAASLYAAIGEIEARPGIVDASIWIGFAWADEPRCQAAVVVTGTDAAAVEQAAMGLAVAFWKVRHDFDFVAPTDSFAGCLRSALSSTARPFFLSDSGDNPGAGGAGDCTWALAALADEPRIASGEVRALLASIVDPATVRRAIEVGVGREAEFTVGGRVDTRAPGPCVLRAAVAEIAHDGGGSVVRLVSGGLVVIVTERRAQYSELSQYRTIGVDPRHFDIVVVKMGYLEPDLFAVQRGWLLALTPGGVDQDLRRLGHRHVRRPMIPLDTEIPEPVRVTAKSWG